jgi:hypothetical protein
LLLPYEVLQLDAEQVVVFAAGTSPARLQRIDWRNNPTPRELAHRPPQPYQLSPEMPLVEWSPAPTRHAAGERGSTQEPAQGAWTTECGHGVSGSACRSWSSLLAGSGSSIMSKRTRKSSNSPSSSSGTRR